MSTAAALGVRVSKYTFDKVEYTLSEFDLEDYAKYELFLEETGWAALKRARFHKWIGEYEYKELVREWLSTLATHTLTFGSPDYIVSTQSLPGIRKMLELSLAHKHGEIDQKLLDRMVREDMPGVVAAIRALDTSDDSD
jgi:hypothetical protein